jgi:type I restriction enzyme S subunit
MTSMETSTIPHDWISVQLEEISQLNPKIDKSSYSDDLMVSFVPMAAVAEETGAIDVGDTRTLRQVKKGYTGFQEGDVLFAKITPCMENGKMAVVPTVTGGIGFGSTEFHVFRPYEGINAKYLYYFVSSKRFRYDAEHNMTGAVGQRRVPIDYVAQYSIPLPPKEAQTRIVAKIEELFSELDKGVESLQRAREQLVVFRASILERALFGRAQKEIEYRPLGKLIGNIQQGWSPTCDPNRRPLDDEWAVIKTSVIQPMKYVAREIKPLPSELSPRPGIEVKERDLLMTRKGPRWRTGVVCLVKNVRARSMLCDTVYRFRAKEDVAYPEYLEIALNIPSVVAEINRRKSGISESGISLNHGKIKSLPIPFYSDQGVQKRIVENVQEHLSRIDAVSTEIEQQLAVTDALRQSILKKAFCGRLVPQDPNDEPASVLLERIRAERAAQDKPATRPKRQLTRKTSRKPRKKKTAA